MCTCDLLKQRVLSYSFLEHQGTMGDHSSPSSYIHMVHRLIEECLIFNMSKEECMEALSKHANITPVITSTVWQELEKENREFFEAYTKGGDTSPNERDAAGRIQEMLSSTGLSSN